MKRFKITWEYTQTGTSYIKAEDLDDTKDKAEESITDFGNLNEFTQVAQWDDGWKMESIEEVIEDES